jgi:hypothetical protein
MKKYTHKLVIGRSELVSFPDLYIDTIPAKTDTGAFRSAIHASDIVVKKRGTQEVLSFFLLKDHPGSPYDREVETTSFTKAMVENSFGVEEERYVVVLKIKVGPRICKTEFTLADRSKKTYPILLGRKLTNGRFLVDTNASNVDRRKLKSLKVDLVEDLEVTEL